MFENKVVFGIYFPTNASIPIEPTNAIITFNKGSEKVENSKEIGFQEPGNLSLIALTKENKDIANPLIPKIPNPGVTNNSNAIKIIPIEKNTRSSIPDKPAMWWPKKNNIRQVPPSNPKKPNPGVLNSSHKPPIPMSIRIGATLAIARANFSEPVVLI